MSTQVDSTARVMIMEGTAPVMKSIMEGSTAIISSVSHTLQMFIQVTVGSS